MIMMILQRKLRNRRVTHHIILLIIRPSLASTLEPITRYKSQDALWIAGAVFGVLARSTEGGLVVPAGGSLVGDSSAAVGPAASADGGEEPGDESR